MKKRIKISIAGGTGYTGGELLRLLLMHPDADVVSVLSTSSAGEKLSSIHRDLIGESDLNFVSGIKDGDEPDVIFLCLGHGLSRDFLFKNKLPEWCRIIDLGSDFRVESSFQGKNFIYGLCEMNRREISSSQYVANPGCFATAIQLALLPLASDCLITDDVHISAITGSTGAGKKLAEPSHFSYRDSNISVYKPFTHQHLEEIIKSLGTLQGGKLPQVNFVPFRGDFTRGIFASIYTKSSMGEKDAIALFQDYYKNEPFVHISDSPINLKEVVNTNKCLLHIEMHNGYAHITSIIDNLVKGASGQAIQNMNLMFGLPETSGLRLKPSAF